MSVIFFKKNGQFSRESIAGWLCYIHLHLYSTSGIIFLIFQYIYTFLNLKWITQNEEHTISTPEEITIIKNLATVTYLTFVKTNFSSIPLIHTNMQHRDVETILIYYGELSLNKSFAWTSFQTPKFQKFIKSHLTGA